MLAFIIWSVGTYDIGLVEGNAPPEETLLYMKIHLSGVISAFTLFVFFALSLTRKYDLFKNPFTYILIIPSVYLLYLIWTSDISYNELNMFSMMTGTEKEFSLFSTIFGVAGIYLLLRHYMTSKYREKRQAKLILAGAIASILIAISSNIILPMFFNTYFLALSNLAPAVMGVFFAYSVYQYGLFIKPMPELSVTSFCGVECTLCPEYLNDVCPGCKFHREKYRNCEVYRCVAGKGFAGCGECPDIIVCPKRTKNIERDFSAKPMYEMEPGITYFIKGNGYGLLLDAIKHGTCGLIATTSDPQEIKEKFGLTTTPIIWISKDAAELGVEPGDIKRLSILLMNFMKKIGNAVVFLDGLDTLIKINGLDNIHPIIRILSSTASTTNSRLIIETNLEDENLDNLVQGLNYVKLDNI